MKPTHQSKLLAILLGTALLASHSRGGTIYTWTHNDNNNKWPDDGNWSGGSGAPGRSANDDTAILDGSFSNTSSDFDLELTSQNRPGSPVTIAIMDITTDSSSDEWDITEGYTSGAILRVSGEMDCKITNGGSFDIFTDLKMADALLTIGASGNGVHVRGDLIGNNSGSGDGTLNLNSSAGSFAKNGFVHFHGSNPDFDGTVEVGFTKLYIQNTAAFENATIELAQHGGGSDRINYVTNSQMGALTGVKNLELVSGKHLKVGSKGTDFTYDGLLEGTGTVEKVGSGAWTLNGANTHTGSTTITSGQIKLGHADALKTTPLIINGSNALDVTSNNIDANLHSLSGSGVFGFGSQTLTLNGNFAGNYTYDGTIESSQFGTLAFDLGGSGKQILTGNNSSSLLSTIELLSGTVQINDNTQLGSPNTGLVYGDGHLLAIAPSDFTLNKNNSFADIDSHAKITVFNSSSTITIPRSLTGDVDNILEVLSGGKVAFTSLIGSYPGTLRANGGTLEIASASIWQDASFDLLSDNSLVLPDSNVKLGSISGSGDFSIGSSNILTLGDDNRSTTYTGTISGNVSSQVQKVGTGTFTFGGSLSLTEDFDLDGGTLVLDGDTSTTMATGVQGSNGTTVSGTGRVSGALDTEGDIAPSDPGSSVYGTLRAGAHFPNGRYLCDVSDGGVDLLWADGVFEIPNCDLEINLPDGALTQSSYVIAQYVALTGKFSSITGLPAGYNIDYAYGGNSIALVEDSTAPTLDSISLNASLNDPTNETTIIFDITFSEDVTGVDKNDFVITYGGSTGNTSLTGSGDSYQFTIPSVGGNGVLTVSLDSGTGIQDLALNAIGASSTTGSVTIDNIKPVITRNGDAIVEIELGDPWVDPGATANDSLDGSVAVTVGGDTVDPNTLGTYIITYDAVDAAGNTANQKTRTVNVIQSDPFTLWTDSFGLAGNDALPTADPDGDGDSNEEEFAFDGDPTAATISGKRRAEISNISGTDYLTLTVAVRSGASFSGSPSLTADIDGITYTFAGSTDLLTFDSSVTEVSPADSAGLPTPSTGWEYRTFRLTSGIDSLARGFLKADVEQTPE